MTRCPRKGRDGDPICNGFVFYPEFGPPRCSNALCDWGLRKATPMNWSEDK